MEKPAAGHTRGRDLLEEAFAFHQEALLDHARQLLGSRRWSDARDFVQETMARLVERFPDGPPPEPRCLGWLMTTLTNLLISDWRKHSVRERAMADPAHLVALPQPLPSPGPLPPASRLDAVMDRLTAEDFRAAIQSLSPKLRETYELHVLGLGHAEIAARLRISRVALRKRLHDARGHLREYLQLGLDQTSEDEDQDED